MFDPLPRDLLPRLTVLSASLAKRHLILEALADGSSPGNAYVDRFEQPTAAYVASAEGRFLLGDPNVDAFNDALSRFLRDGPYSGAREEWEEAVVLYCDEGWKPVLEQVILPFRPPFASPRRHYLFEGTVAPVPTPPAGMTLCAVDADLLARRELHHLEDIEFWVVKNWGTAENFLTRGFGVCLVEGDRIVSWSLADCVHDRRCEIGIETDEAYRRRGLATTVTAAMVEACLLRGYRQVGWHCWEHNHGSIGVAEKVGFTHRATYPAYLSYFDPLMHVAAEGYGALGRGEFELASARYAEVAAMPEAPAWANYQLARCQAMLNAADAALESLSRAVEQGWAERDAALANPHFAILHGYPAWKQIIEAMS